MKEKTIILPENLSERRSILEAELAAVVEVQVTASLSEDLKEVLNDAGFTEGTATIEWEFHGEYDDEGGTDYRARVYNLVVNGEGIDYEDDEIYDETGVYLPDAFSDILCSHSDDLYDQYITEITVTLH